MFGWRVRGFGFDLPANLVLRRLSAMAIATVIVSVLLVGCSSLRLGEDSAESQLTEPEAPATVEDESMSSVEVEPVEEAPDPEAIIDIWERADDAVLRPDGPTSSFNAILAPIADDEPWFIAGSVSDPDTSQGTAAIWEVTTPASGRWKRIDLPPRAEDGNEFVNAIVRAGESVVIGGTEGRGPEARAAVWISAEGGEWERIVGPAFESDEPERLLELDWDDQASLLVAQGTRTTSDGSPRSVYWSSVDGRDWNRMDLDSLTQSELSRPTSLALGPTGLVAAGSVEDGDKPAEVRLWLSDDGSTWRTIEPESMTGPEPVYVNDIVVLDGEYVAVGSVRNDGLFNPASWTSSDGETWDGPFESWQVNDDGRATTVGFGAAAVVTTGDRLLATATRSFMQHVWSSTDGRNWQPVANIWDVRDPGVVLNDVDSDGTLVAAVSDEPSVLFHDTIWNVSPLDDEIVPEPSEVPFISDVTFTSDGFVAVGGTQARPGRLRYEYEGEVWISADGQTWESDKAFPRNDLGSMTSVSSIDGEPFISMTQSIESAQRRNVRGAGLLLRRNTNAWGSVYELSAPDRRSAISNSVLSGDEVIVGGWQFGLDRTSTEARLGVVPLSDIDRPSSTPLTMDEPSIWNGEARAIHRLCVDDEGTVTAIGEGVTDANRLFILAASRPVAGEWEESLAADESFTGADSQLANGCADGVDGMLLAGWVYNNGDQDAALWSRRADGQWERLEIDELAGEGDQRILEMVTVGDSYVLLGYDDGSGFDQATLWVGSGTDWKAMPVGPAASALFSLQLATDAGSDSAVDPADSKLVLTGWQYSRAVTYHTTFGEVVAAADELTALKESG